KGPAPVKTGEFFKGRKVAVFALPGAFTPTCSNQHLPGFIKSADDFKAKGVDEIVCLSVNDAFVMGAWGKQQGADITAEVTPHHLLLSDDLLDTYDGTGPTVVVVGSEGKGLSRLVRENCDSILSIPISGGVESLNASVAAGVVLSEFARQRRVKG
ncbi:MAG: redoxin family protein, partial [Dietzia cercidiphylli]